MKIVLAGTTGFIGREVLAQCISDPSIASIVALSRRDLPAATANNPKLKVVILQDHDFLAYPDSVLQDIRDAQACIWCLGKAGIPNNETTRKVSVDYTIAAARAFSSVLPNDNDETNKFRFVYLSGGIAERDQMKPLWFLQEYRRIRVRFIFFCRSSFSLYILLVRRNFFICLVSNSITGRGGKCTCRTRGRKSRCL